MDMRGGQPDFLSSPWETLKLADNFSDGHTQLPGRVPISPSSTYSSLSSDSASAAGSMKAPVEVYQGSRMESANRRSDAPRSRGVGLSQGLMARQMVLQQYDTAKDHKITKERLKAGRTSFDIRTGTKKQAESSRVKKAPTPDEVRDPESMSGMKYQLHWDRERIARDKALRLLDGAFGEISVL